MRHVAHRAGSTLRTFVAHGFRRGPLFGLPRSRALAAQDLVAGARVKSVARRLGYSSPEALARAVQAEFGASPTELRAA